MSFEPTKEEEAALEQRASEAIERQRGSGTPYEQFVKLQQYYTFLMDNDAPSHFKTDTKHKEQLHYYYWDAVLPDMIAIEMKKLHPEVNLLRRALVYATRSRGKGGSRKSRKSMKSRKSRKSRRR